MVRRVIHPSGVIFKGSGWYITDSRKSGGDSASLASSPNGTKTDGEATKTENTPAENKSTESKPAEKVASATEG